MVHTEPLKCSLEPEKIAYYFEKHLDIIFSYVLSMDLLGTFELVGMHDMTLS